MTGEPEIKIGISGWTYPPWRGVFYPAKLRQKDELAYVWAAGRQPKDMHCIDEFASGGHACNIYAYFDNDVKVRAPGDAKALADRLGVGPVADEGK